MSTSKVRAAKAAAVGSLALFMTAGVASVAQATPARGAAPAGDVTVLSCQNAGGGT